MSQVICYPTKAQENGSPKILLPAVDCDEEFVQIPGIAEATLFPLKTPGILGAEFPTPSPDGFVRNRDSAFGQKIFHIPEAKTEAMIDPHGVANDLGREPGVDDNGIESAS